MAECSDILPENKRAWMLAIGRRLRADYDAALEPVPERLAALIKRLGPAPTRNIPEIQAGSSPLTVTASRFDPDGHRSSLDQPVESIVRTPSYASKLSSDAPPVPVGL